MSDDYLEGAMQRIEQRNAHQDEFLQAVRDVIGDVGPEFAANPAYQRNNLLERLAEPDRIISFRVSWEDDGGAVHVNRGWRVQHSNAIGPYKGGLRFHPSVNESVLKFLAFEQTFKNALTGMYIGGGKGGSDFDPRGRSDSEIMRFCFAFMDELYRYIGERVDVPAGDINVGPREIGYLFGHYRRLANNFSGALTGKDIEFGGSHVRLEATGFGLIYFLREMLDRSDAVLADRTVAISGSGNVALHAAQKAIEFGARVVTLSSSTGFLHVPEGFHADQIAQLVDSKEGSTDKLRALGTGDWHPGEKPWRVSCDIALPCATQNELDGNDAAALVEGGCTLVAEGANMPCTEAAVVRFEEEKILHAPGKASNAGGVAVSALEMSQNAEFSRREFADLDNELQSIMRGIHQRCVEYGSAENGFVNYRRGANIAAFRRVANALVAQGIG